MVNAFTSMMSLINSAGISDKNLRQRKIGLYVFIKGARGQRGRKGNKGAPGKMVSPVLSFISAVMHFPPFKAEVGNVCKLS